MATTTSTWTNNNNNNNASNGNVWTSVQNSSAWPVNQQQNISKKNVVTSKNPQTVNNNAATTTPFQWSSSWNPVMNSPTARHQKKSNGQNSIYNAPTTILKKDVPKKSISPGPMMNLNQQQQQQQNNNNNSTQYDIQLVPTYPIATQMIQHPITLSNDPTQETNTIFEYGSADPNFASMQSFAAANANKKKKKSTEEKQLIEDELSKQNLYKTELCRSFCETGMCRYGHKCQFAHGEHELRPVLRHPKYKTETCKTFSNSGTCPYGNRCRFVHPGVTFGSWDDNTMITGMIPLLPDSLIGVMDQLSINGMVHPHYRQNIHAYQHAIEQQEQQQQDHHQQQHQQHQHHQHQQQQTQNLVQPATFVVPTSKQPESADVKTIVEDDEDSDNKPRLAFFQNLTVI